MDGVAALQLRAGEVRGCRARAEEQLVLLLRDLVHGQRTPEVGMSMIMSTLSASNHWWAMVEPTSRLVRWSAETISTFTFG